MSTILTTVLEGRDFPTSTLKILWNQIGRSRVAILPVLGEAALGLPEREQCTGARQLAAALQEAQLHFYWLDCRWERGRECPLVFVSAPADRELFGLTIARLVQEHGLVTALCFEPGQSAAEYYSRSRRDWIALTEFNVDQFPAVWAEIDPTGGCAEAKRRRLEVGRAWLWRERHQEEPRTWGGALALQARRYQEQLRTAAG